MDKDLSEDWRLDWFRDWYSSAHAHDDLEMDPDGTFNDKSEVFTRDDLFEAYKAGVNAG